MALTHVRWICLALVMLPACGGGPEPAAESAEPETLSVTRWTDKTELFAEHAPLVVGETSRFAVHLTRLDTFKPLTDGRVEVRLQGGAAAAEVFRAEAPSRPGIFGVDVTPAHAGARRLVIALRAAGLADEHLVGDITVHATADSARAARDTATDGGGVSFLKEQQWALDFATAVVREEPVRESLRVPARIDARPGGAADVAAPIDGRLARVLDLPLGATVSRGQELARLQPPPSSPADLPQLQRARVDAQTSLSLATRDRERAERLVAAGAAPQKRLEDARAAEQRAHAALTAADAGLAQFHAARGAGTPGTAGLFLVRAPITGVIAARDATTGANVIAGSTLFRVVDASQVHVVGRVTEADARRAAPVTSAEIELTGQNTRTPAGGLVGVGRVLDPESRTLPITFAFDNSTARLPVGQAVFLHLLLDAAAPRPTVPVTAVVDDAGRPIVFVQREGETFERRPVNLGPRAGGVTQVLDGVAAGDRVVTKGASFVRLASLSTSVPAHGHVH